MAETRADLSAYEPDQIYNMDETGLFFRCLPNRAYVTSGRRRRARETKAMKAKDRVTLVLACNATGTHKVPVAIIGTAEVPLCFKRPRSLCPLPYFNQKTAWMDADVYEKWFKTIFVPAVRARTSLPVALVMDNCGAHSKRGHAQVTTIPLPPNVISNHQPLDAGIIAALKRRHKRRLLALVLEAFERTRSAQLAASRGRPSSSGGGPSAAAVSAIGASLANRAPGMEVIGAPMPAEGAPVGWAGGPGPAGETGHGEATSASASSGVAGGFRPHCVAGGGANTSSILGCARPGQSLSVGGAADTVRRQSGARPSDGIDWAKGDTPSLPHRAGMLAGRSPTTVPTGQAVGSVGLVGAGAAATASSGPMSGPEAYEHPAARNLPVEPPPRLQNVWGEPPPAEDPPGAGSRRRARQRRTTAPRLLRGVWEGGEAHDKDAAGGIKKEWEAFEPATTDN